METVTLTIDGQSVIVETGKTVLQAAIEHGISVPKGDVDFGPTLMLGRSR